MSINIGDNFSYLGKKFLDSRQSFETFEEMMACSDVPEGFITFCKENNQRYEYIGGEWIEYVVGKGNADIDEETLEKIEVAYEHSQSKHLQLNDLKDYATKDYVDEAIESSNQGKIPFISTTSPSEALVKTGESFDIAIDFFSVTTGDGTIKISVNDFDAVSTKIAQGETVTSVPSDKFKKGDNTIVVYVLDRAGVMSNSLTFYVRYGGTEMVSTFDPYTYYENGSTTRYYFTPSALDTSKTLTFYMIIDGVQQVPVVCTSDIRSFFSFPTSLQVGVHKCEAWVTDGETESERHIFNFILIDNASILVATDTYNASTEEGDQIVIDYKVYSITESSFKVKVYVDNNLVSEGECGLAKNYYRTSSLTEGVHTVKIEAWNKSETTSGYCTSEVNITKSTFEILTPIKTGATFIATAVNKSNANENRDKWIGITQDDEEVVATLQNFIFDTTDGWHDDLLTFNGVASAHIPISPLANNAKYGFTLDITFSTKPIGINEAEVLTLWDDEKDCGIKITTEEVILKSASGNKCDLYFSEEAIVNAMFIIDREQKMAKIYLNGVMCEAFALSDYENNGVKYLEDFATNSEIFINKFGGYAQIKEIRVYEVALTTEEVLNNFISTKTMKAEQKALVEFQKGDTLPTLTIYCDFSGLGKDDKKPCNIVYNSPDTARFGQSFVLEHKTSQLQYQGTSSMAYPIKNYRINLRDKDGEKWKYNPFPGGQPEARFCLKADFMSSGHWQNTGLAKWVNDNLYNYNSDDEKSMNPIKWHDLQNGVPMSAHRESIYGFPCRLILVNDGTTPLNEGQNEPTPGNTKDMGVFNFNNDKDNTDTLGFDADIFPYCASYEISANSDTSAGAFMSYKGGGSKEDEEAYYLESFELRYPDADDVGDAWGMYDVDKDTSMGLKRLIDWVDNCTDEEFIRDFEQYFHKQYTLRYYLLVITLG